MPEVKIKVDTSELKKVLEMTDELKNVIGNIAMPVQVIRIGAPKMVKAETESTAGMGNKKVREMTSEEYMKRHKDILLDGRIKSNFLREFKFQELNIERAFEEEPEQSKKFIEIAEDIVEILKVEELTYEQAYATLQQAYNQLKYEANFLKI